MAKEQNKQQHTIKELKALFLIGPDLPIDPEIEKALKNRDDCLIVGDGKDLIDLEQLKQTLKEKNLKIGSNTRIDINGHGGRKEDGQHSISLFRDTQATKETFETLKNIAEPNSPLYVHLWSCYGGSANKSIEDLGKGSILLTHIEAKETESVSLGNYSINSSLKRYLDPNNNLTPHQQFVLDIQEN
ncbi:MAG: ankyrin repeat domain-containing protein, partial [Rickettsia endosymbiont of Bryobia graminum]|nr:ankyrin repeat domain-containing protein [Rickettsia endosymbiont of Bryobia graminum]